MNILIITQARIGSSRFPSKILKKINEDSLLEIHLSRLIKSKRANGVIVATTFEKDTDKIELITKKLGINFFQGDTEDVLDRYYKAAIKYSADYIVRVTSDCPLIDPNLLDKVIDFTLKENLDYGSNVLIHNYPDGQDIEVFKFDALKFAWQEADNISEREHVTPYIINNSSFYGKNSFKAKNFSEAISTKFSKIRMTVDYEIDIELIRYLINEKGKFSDWQTYAELFLNTSKNFKNQEIKRNESYLKQIENESK